MSDLTQKKCPAVTTYNDPETGEQVEAVCGKRAVKIQRDKFGMRTCECGHTWLPSKRKAEEE